MRHIQSSLSSLGQLSRAPFNTIMTCAVIGIALALPMALFVLLKNMDMLSHQFQQSTQFTLYLKADTTESTATTLLHTLEKSADIQSAQLISPTQGMQELQQQTGIDNILAELQNNPLPWAISATPVARIHTPASLEAFKESLQKMDDVDSVQLDTLWIQRLFALVSLAHRAVYAIAIFLGLGVLLIVNNCIRTATQHSKKEIDIIKFVGGTNAFIRKPFLYAGMIYGLLGGIMAWLLVDLFVFWIRTPANQLAALYHSQFQLLGISLNDTVLILGLSALLGLIGAWIAVTRQLHTTQLN